MDGDGAGDEDRAAPTDGILAEEVGSVQRDHDLEDKPPQYDELSLPGDLATPLPLPLSYEEALAAVKAAERGTGGSLVAEAPPAYAQLFGEQRRGVRRPHTRTRRGSSSGDGHSSTDGGSPARGGLLEAVTRTTIGRIAITGTVILLLMAVPVSMVIVGYLNYDVCQYSEVPLYLIVAGVLIILEIVLHSLLFTCKKYVDDESVFHKLRRCDILLFILFIWLLVGTNWIFRTSIVYNNDDCEEDMGGDIVSMNYTIEVNGTTVHVPVNVGAQEGMEGGVRGGDCEDCSRGVYFFAAIVILGQYVLALLLFAFCCTRLFRKPSN